MLQPPTKFDVHRWHTFNFSVLVTFWPQTLCALLPMGWATFLTILVFWGLFVSQTDHATFTFNLGAHGTCQWYSASWFFICVPSLKFVGLSVRKIWHTLISALICIVIGDLDLLTLKLVHFIVHFPRPAYGYVIYFIAVSFTFASMCIWFMVLLLIQLEAEELRERFTQAATQSPSIIFFYFAYP